jgi:hypothetical protein
MSAQRIDEIIELLQDFALGKIELPHGRVAAALALLNLTVPDARPPDDGAADDQAVLTFH